MKNYGNVIDDKIIINYFKVNLDLSQIWFLFII